MLFKLRRIAKWRIGFVVIDGMTAENIPPEFQRYVETGQLCVRERYTTVIEVYSARMLRRQNNKRPEFVAKPGDVISMTTSKNQKLTVTTKEDFNNNFEIKEID